MKNSESVKCLMQAFFCFLDPIKVFVVFCADYNAADSVPVDSEAGEGCQHPPVQLHIRQDSDQRGQIHLRRISLDPVSGLL